MTFSEMRCTYVPETANHTSRLLLVHYRRNIHKCSEYQQSSLEKVVIAIAFPPPQRNGGDPGADTE
jgi:hypothetical protein